MTQDEAKELAESKFWEDLTFRQRAEFQMTEPRLCMPFDVFHEAIEKTLGRPVWTHEFGLNYEGIKAEIFQGKSPPTMQEIIEMIPEDKRIILVKR